MFKPELIFPIHNPYKDGIAEVKLIDPGYTEPKTDNERINEMGLKTMSELESAYNDVINKCSKFSSSQRKLIVKIYEEKLAQ